MPNFVTVLIDCIVFNERLCRFLEGIYNKRIAIKLFESCDFIKLPWKFSQSKGIEPLGDYDVYKN